MYVLQVYTCVRSTEILCNLVDLNFDASPICQYIGSFVIYITVYQINMIKKIVEPKSFHIIYNRVSL